VAAIPFLHTIPSIRPAGPAVTTEACTATQRSALELPEAILLVVVVDGVCTREGLTSWALDREITVPRVHPVSIVEPCSADESGGYCNRGLGRRPRWGARKRDASRVTGWAVRWYVRGCFAGVRSRSHLERRCKINNVSFLAGSATRQRKIPIALTEQVLTLLLAAHLLRLCSVVTILAHIVRHLLRALAEARRGRCHRRGRADFGAHNLNELAADLVEASKVVNLDGATSRPVIREWEPL